MRMDCRRTGYHEFKRLVFFGGHFCERCRGVWDYFGNEWR